MNIKNLLSLNIEWEYLSNKKGPEFKALVDGKEAILVINDFPDEIMYTLTWSNHSISFDDRPDSWKFPTLI